MKPRGSPSCSCLHEGRVLLVIKLPVRLEDRQRLNPRGDLLRCRVHAEQPGLVLQHQQVENEVLHRPLLVLRETAELGEKVKLPQRPRQGEIFHFSIDVGLRERFSVDLDQPAGLELLHVARIVKPCEGHDYDDGDDQEELALVGAESR